jgi:hypothetical protein
LILSTLSYAANTLNFKNIAATATGGEELKLTEKIDVEGTVSRKSWRDECMGHYP